MERFSLFVATQKKGAFSATFHYPPRHLSICQHKRNFNSSTNTYLKQKHPQTPFRQIHPHLYIILNPKILHSKETIMPDDKEISMKRMRAFKDKEAELKLQGKSAAEADRGASEHLAKLEDEKPNEYLRAKDRKARKKAMKIEEKESKAREQDANGGEGALCGH
jgi:secreted Zn-dependent insulinase-like peptidase